MRLQLRNVCASCVVDFIADLHMKTKRVLSDKNSGASLTAHFFCVTRILTKKNLRSIRERNRKQADSGPNRQKDARQISGRR
jgi:hypothetical protein